MSRLEPIVRSWSAISRSLPQFAPARRPYARRRQWALGLERLEDRVALSTFTVSNTLDSMPGQPPVDGSLRQAIERSDRTLGPNEIDFAPGLSGTITLTNGQLTIANNVLTIVGPGADVLSVSGNHASRVFEVDLVHAAFSGLTITGGSVSSPGVPDHRLFVGGGGLYNNDGMVTITACAISGNSVSDLSVGGGIFNSTSGTVTIADSTLSGNFAAFGGGISTSGTVTIADSTLSGNSVSAGDGFQSGGGGIDNEGGTVTLDGSTLSGNSAGFTAGGIVNFNFGTVTVTNTILAKNTAAIDPDVEGTLDSQGHNLIGNGSGGSYAPTDLVGTTAHPIDPRLGPLQDNGGPTQTMALLPGSPAIDAGDNTNAPEWDQRGPGFPRIVNGRIDIGAFEVQAVTPSVTCTVADSLLWPANHKLVNVGLGVGVDPTGATLHLQVYANDGATAADAANIGPDTLRLRAERQGGGQGRVYLIVATATNASGQRGFDVCTVVVPHDRSAASLAAVKAAAAAEAYYREFQAAPTGYALLSIA